MRRWRSDERISCCCEYEAAMQHCGRYFVLLFVIFAAAARGVSSVPTTKDAAAAVAAAELGDIFKGTKRDASSTPLKSAMYNPYAYPALFPGKPFFYPFLTPADVVASRATAKPTADAGKRSLDPTSVGSYFKARKDEFLSKLFDTINGAGDAAELAARSVVAAPAGTVATPMDGSFFMNKKFDFLDKLFKSLNVTNATEVATMPDDAEAATTAKPTIVPPSFWFPMMPKIARPTKAPKPPKAKKVMKDALDAMLLQSLLKELATEAPTEVTKRAASEFKKSKKVKPDEKDADCLDKFATKAEDLTSYARRSTFLDELLHRIPPTPTAVAATAASPAVPAAPAPESCVCANAPCPCSTEGAKKSRSLAFKPFGTGYWLPQYLYAAKMGLYMDKLMDTVNTAAVADATTEATSTRRSAPLPAVNLTGLTPKEAALTLLLAELTEVKNNIVEAFADGVKAQKAAAATATTSGKGFKKPGFWAAKIAPTADPVEPIQKRIDVLNGIFDKLTEVEKALLKEEEPEAAKTAKEDAAEAEPKTWVPKFMTVKAKPADITEQDLLQSTNPDDADKARDLILSMLERRSSHD